METPKVVTKVGAVRLPEPELVTLDFLKTVDDKPVTVRCHAIDELVIADATDSWPGSAPQTKTERERRAKRSPRDERAEVRRFAALAPVLLPLGTSFDDEDGSEVRPAFYFEGGQRHPKSLPASALRLSEIVDLVLGVLRASGHLGGVADKAQFPARKRNRVGARA